MKTLIIPIHSFVDVITNSSSEVFVTADRKSVESVKALVDAILKAGGSDKRCDDLFVITLGSVDGGYGEYKTIEAHAKNKDSQEAADLLDTITEMFNPETIGND